MKQYEELSRMRVDEAIQTGLRSQAIRRARDESRRLASPTSPEKAGQPDLYRSTRPGLIALFFSWLLGAGG